MIERDPLYKRVHPQYYFVNPYTRIVKTVTYFFILKIKPILNSQKNPDKLAFTRHNCNYQNYQTLLSLVSAAFADDDTSCPCSGASFLLIVIVFITLTTVVLEQHEHQVHVCVLGAATAISPSSSPPPPLFLQPIKETCKIFNSTLATRKAVKAQLRSRRTVLWWCVGDI